MTESSKEELEHLYVVENKSMNEISKITDISVGKIHRLIHDYKIPVKPQHQGFKGKHHTDEAKKKISNIHYLVMECIIGRRLNDGECVHHINFIRDDNRKENLKLMTKIEHMSLHAKLRHLNKEEKYNE